MPEKGGRAAGLRPALRVLVPLVLFLTSSLSYGQTNSVRVIPDRRSLTMGQTLTLRIVIQGRPDSVRGPAIPDFDVLGKSTGTSISIVNNQVSQEQTTTLTLSPRKPGTLKIGKVEMVVAGRVAAASDPILIQVGGRGSPRPSPRTPPGTSSALPGMQRPSPTIPSIVPPATTAPPDTAKYAGQQAFLVARAPDRTLYAGEPIYVEYVLYVRDDVPLQGIRVDTPPALKDFVVEQPPQEEDRGRMVRLHGRRFEAHVQWRGALSALHAGKAVLDPMTVVIFVGDFFSQRRYKVSSDPVTLNFIPTPAKGRPADFTQGSVGSFVVKAELDKPQIRVGDSALLTIEVTGSGNLRAIRSPDIRHIEGLRISSVPTADLDELVVDKGGLSGKRTFQFLLTPQREGTFQIGRINISFFNSMSGKYERSRTGIIRLKASGTGGGGPVLEAKNSPETLTIIEKSDLTPAAPPSPPDMRLLYAGLSLPLVFFAFAEVWRRRRDYLQRNGRHLARRAALRRAVQGLSHLKTKSDTDPTGFWTAMDGIVHEYLAARFNLPVTGMTHEEIRAFLLNLGASEQMVDPLIAELESCAFGRFAPSAVLDTDRQASIGRIRECLTALDKVGD
ncbi:MAG: protein BatD [Deltaproteobacteria bacterium]|nr:protein BatD [Deltaproteobacteria bacterium]